MRETPQPVSSKDLESLLKELQLLPGLPAQGFFGPDSITWRINRESAVFLGAGRAALLQLAHPWVAAALQQHSNLMHDAIGRFHSTFRVIYTMLFGSRSQALAASRQLYRVHTFIQGELPENVGAYTRQEHYAANEVSALRWVFATLVESAVLAHDFARPALSAADRENYYRESQRMATLCGIPPQNLPSDWEALQQYTASMMCSDSLAVSDEARRMGQAVLSGVGTWVRGAAVVPRPHRRVAFTIAAGRLWPAIWPTRATLAAAGARLGAPHLWATSHSSALCWALSRGQRATAQPCPWLLHQAKQPVLDGTSAPSLRRSGLMSFTATGHCTRWLTGTASCCAPRHNAPVKDDRPATEYWLYFPMYSGQKAKKALRTGGLFGLHEQLNLWRPRRDSNPCYRRERGWR